MIQITTNAECIAAVLTQIKDYLGGEISERWGEYTLNFDNKIAKGSIRCISFDWGVSLFEFDAICFEDVLFIDSHTKINPLHFTFCSHGYFKHRFEHQKDYRTINQYHASILVAKENVKHYTLLEKDTHVTFNNIQIIRKKYIKKRNNQLSALNGTLYRVFVDKKGTATYAYYSPLHIRMEEQVKSLRTVNSKGIIRILQIEGEVYQLLAMHIARHDWYEKGQPSPITLLQKELQMVKTIAEKILKEPSINYSLEYISKDSGLSQAKLQEGFKYLYARTVTEYIRHVRLEAARDLMNTTDLNISQIVYTIGFTSRSYFSKIFKEKYNITPNEFKKQIWVMDDDPTKWN
ncbi:AraC-like DNA-binding protein [Gelidibacter sediminis]|uniref:AraC-like DNA-binding protein n=1 Tax=Gelidibacter sediminis TaxID=1608710 RepID=A0A4R7PXB0_9FLAO|nr:AraC family transcriptional regulator [Gelidibacter sediminis]TDU39568.1 AraC-like DNA-binding protein [Gelidibacter sediminis]